MTQKIENFLDRISQLIFDCLYLMLPTRPWRRLNITQKFILPFVALLVLMGLVAFTGFWSMNAVIHETEATIVAGINVQRQVFEMDAALKSARQIEKDFFLRWPTIGFSSVSTTIVQAHQEQIDKVREISNTLQEFIASANVSASFSQANSDLIAYVELVERYGRSFKEAVELVGTLANDDVGVLARLEQSAATLHDMLILADEPSLIVSFREMYALENEYLSTRQNNKVQFIYNAVERLRQTIRLTTKLGWIQQAQMLAYLNSYESLAKQIVKLDEAILNKVSSFDVQAAVVSEKLIGLANAEVKRSRLRIEGTSHLATGLQILAVLAALAAAAVIANIVTTVSKKLQAEQENSERLLLNILPQPIAQRLKQGDSTIADSFQEASVMFADIVGFSELSLQNSPIELVEILNVIFSEFDQLAEQYGLEKIKTIGDAYMVAGGLPVPQENHTFAIADMALDMQASIAQFCQETGQDLSIRIGINTGPVVAGVIGTKKFVYDLWGETVNTASRMESHGLPGRIQVTEATYKCLQHKYYFVERGLIKVKGKGEMRCYFLKGRKFDPKSRTEYKGNKK